MPIGRLQLVDLRSFDDRQGPADHNGVQRVAFGGCRRSKGDVLHQGLDQDRRALEHQPLRREHHAVNDGAFKELAAGTDHHPAQPSQPAPVVQRLQEALGIAAVLDQDEDMLPVGAGDGFSRVGPGKT